MGLNSVDVHGLDGFLKLLDRRKDLDSRERGLLTGKVLNHNIILGKPFLVKLNALQYQIISACTYVICIPLIHQSPVSHSLRKR